MNNNNNTSQPQINAEALGNLLIQFMQTNPGFQSIVNPEGNKHHWRYILYHEELEQQMRRSVDLTYVLVPMTGDLISREYTDTNQSRTFRRSYKRGNTVKSCLIKLMSEHMDETGEPRLEDGESKEGKIKEMYKNTLLLAKTFLAYHYGSKIGTDFRLKDIYDKDRFDVAILFEETVTKMNEREGKMEYIPLHKCYQCWGAKGLFSNILRDNGARRSRSGNAAREAQSSTSMTTTTVAKEATGPSPAPPTPTTASIAIDDQESTVSFGRFFGRFFGHGNAQSQSGDPSSLPSRTRSRSPSSSSLPRRSLSR